MFLILFRLVVTTVLPMENIVETLSQILKKQNKKITQFFLLFDLCVLLKFNSMTA